MKVLLTLILGLAAVAPANAQDFNYVPGWANTYNHSQVGKSAEPRELEPCRYGMLPRSEQQRLHEMATAKVEELGEEAALPWIDRQSAAVIAQMVEEDKCRGS